MSNTRVWAKLSPEIHEYFFRKVLAGEQGAKQGLTIQFFTALYNECQHRRVPPTWSVENTQLIADIMSKLNFNDDFPERPRCPANTLTQHKEEPPCGPDDPG